MRCFVAVDVPEGLRAAVGAAQARLRAAAPAADVRWTEPAGFHLTLKFLGEVAERRAGELVAALGAAVAGRPPPALAAGGLGAFPAVRRARIVWLGLTAGAADLAALAAAVERALVPLGFPAEVRPFHGHVTLGRVRSPRGAAALGAALERSGGLEIGTWSADEVVLYRSHLGRTGARYEALARLALGPHP